MNIVLASRRKYMRKRTNPEGAPASIEDCIVALVRDSYPYTGQAITPQVTVTTQDGVPLVVNVDYFVSYADNVNVGAGTVTVTGAGEYVGSVIKTFQITSAAPQAGWDNLDISRAVVNGYANFSDIVVDSDPGVISNAKNPYYYVDSQYLGDFTGASICGRIRSSPNDYVMTVQGLDGMLINESGKILNATARVVENGGWGYSDTGATYSFIDEGNRLLFKRGVSGYTSQSTYISVKVKRLPSPYDINNPLDSSINSRSIPFSDLDGISSIESNINFLKMSSDGLHLYIITARGSSSGNNIVQFDLITPFEPYGGITRIGMASITEKGKMIEDSNLTLRDLLVSPDGKHIVVLWNRLLAKFSLSEQWNVASVWTLQSYKEFYNPDEGVISGYANSRRIWINESGSRALMVANYFENRTDIGSRIVSLAF